VQDVIDGRKWVSGRSGSKTSLAQNSVIISPLPTLVMEWVYPGGMSITR
jgi:hypothetical protein